mmetsp:Transcript_67998/g.191645  ORF Transcript_67998/g.191645 Transcript_67998/m.191645 type:complete len:210 (-) Transcript_67998:867-1496(-)
MRRLAGSATTFGRRRPGLGRARHTRRASGNCKKKNGSSSACTTAMLASILTSTTTSPWRCRGRGRTRCSRSPRLRNSGTTSSFQTSCGTTSSGAGIQGPHPSNGTPRPRRWQAGTRCAAPRPAPGRRAPSSSPSSATWTSVRPPAPSAWKSELLPAPRLSSSPRRASSARRSSSRPGSFPSSRRSAHPRCTAVSRRSRSSGSSPSARTS